MNSRTPTALALQPGNGYRLPPEAYHSESWFRREQRQLFARTWNFAGEARDLPNVGDYLTCDLGGGPILLVRDESRTLRAFHNLCRHRGAKLLDDQGNCRAITCPYHRWQYRLDGALDNVPQQQTQLPGLDPEDWGLVPAALAVWRGLLFVNPDGTAPAFEPWLAGMQDVLAGYHPDRLSVLAEGVFEFRANWKFYIENHVDWYHLWYTHPQTLRMWSHHDGEMLQPGPHWASFEPPSPNATPMTPTLLPIPGISDRARHNGAHLIFPNLTLFTGEGYFATGRVTALAADRCRMDFRALIEPGQSVSDQLQQDFLKAFRDITEVEDAGMTERLQAAVRSPAFAVGPMTQAHEAPIAHLHDAYLQVFERPDATPQPLAL